jgi:hypothetical protein
MFFFLSFLGLSLHIELTHILFSLCLQSMELQAYNPSYSGGGDWEDLGLRIAQVKM